MNRLLIDYWREWRPDILRWIAAILMFALFAWVIVDYFDFFDSCVNRAFLWMSLACEPSVAHHMLNSSDFCWRKDECEGNLKSWICPLAALE